MNAEMNLRDCTMHRMAGDVGTQVVCSDNWIFKFSPETIRNMQCSIAVVVSFWNQSIHKMQCSIVVSINFKPEGFVVGILNCSDRLILDPNNM